MTGAEAARSPRIQALQHALDADPAAAAAVLHRFWGEVAASGTPLIESAGEPDRQLVTFLWRDQELTRSTVVVVGGPATWSPVHDDVMTHLVGTDVWYRSYEVESDFFGRYQLSPDDSLEDPDQVTDWVAREATFCADPLNPHSIDWPANPQDPTVPPHRVSVLRLPHGPDPTLAERDPSAPAGDMTRFRLRSHHLGNERDVWLYTSPEAATGSAPLPLVVLLDGWVWSTALPVAPGLDRLHAGGRLAPLAVAMVDSLDDDTRVRELECHPDYLDFVADELLPQLRLRAPLTTDPIQVTVAGQSLGGLMAAWAALQRPDLTQRVISQSGSFWFERDAGPERAERATRLVSEARRSPITFDLSVGRYEGAEMLDTNRRFRDAATAAGHRVTYREYSGGHDWVAWRLGLLDAIARSHPATMSGGPPPEETTDP